MATALVVACAVGAAYVLVNDRPGEKGRIAAGGACGAEAVVRVAAVPEFAPVATEVARRVDEARGCAAVEVRAWAPADLMDALRTGSAEVPDVWVADSSMRLHQAAAELGDRNPYPLTGTPVAFTPLVVAVPEQVAVTQKWFERPPDWLTLLSRIDDRTLPRFTVGSTRTTEGLLGVAAVSAAMTAANADPMVAAMKTFAFRSNVTDAETPAAALLTRTDTAGDARRALDDVGAFVATEQTLWTHDRARPEAVPYVPLYPSGTLVQADYPAVVSQAAAEDAAKTAGVNAVLEALRSPDGVKAATAAGFRGPDGQPPASTSPNVVFAPPTPVPTPAPQGNPSEAVAMVRAWADYRPMPFRVLLLIDGSGSMNERVAGGGGKTKADIMRDAAVDATMLLGRTTEVGIREFAVSPTQKGPWVEYVPLGPLDEMTGQGARKDVVVRSLTGFTAEKGAGTPLYRSLLDAVADAQKSYNAGAVNQIFLLTDGKDEDTAFGMPKAQFLAELRKLQDPRKPLPVFAVGYGANADMATLTEIATMTGGLAVPSSDPGDLIKAVAQILVHVRTTG
ncbi:substrate-binding domain-containing protein [Yinghuangia sp. ASG 101]|uniref:VWA domain-containing protein n=1 Tax=Yinghuangia sp. ASG 101 TaxID=2896848 RepID=UPI001E5E2CC8|nr:substrate-binding domain-containing protein [Yinghuangia sp. ASG 101]UGQ15020.1 substrate-binding domain-containing protein [Yinghuangia sp. ASG 101]